MNELTERRGPGRPPKYHEQVAQQGSQGLTESLGQTVSAQAVDSGLAARPVRKPFGALDQKLAYAARPGFHRHWFNDVGNRIARAQEAGYEHVKGDDGRNVSKIVGTLEGGGAMTAFIMEIPEEWYQADMKAQQELITDKENQIRRGELESKQGDGRYVPSQGISIKHGA